MNIHEHQAKELLHQFGIPAPAGMVAFTPREAGEAVQQLPGPVFVIKAQIHAGGRGKGKFKEASAGEKGGVRIAKSRAEVQSFAEQMLGATLVTVQTGPTGKAVNRVYVTEGVDIDRELYLSALVDRATSRVAFIASSAGGHGHRAGCTYGAGKDHLRHHRPGQRLHALPRPAHRLRLRPHRQADRRLRQARRRSLQPRARQGHEHAGDQPADGPQGRLPLLPRRQDEL